jgi:hypothetical protein
VVAAVAALPFDEEGERLFRLVTFDGQDRTALLQLIAAVGSSRFASSEAAPSPLRCARGIRRTRR